MAPTTRAIDSSGVIEGSALPERISVYELFRGNLQIFASLPGEISHFDQSDYGYEWRCELELGRCLPGPSADGSDPERVLQLQFSLMDIAGQHRPAAALYLLDSAPAQGFENRLLFPLGDLPNTLDELNEQIARWDGTVEMSARANNFVEALVQVKESLGPQVTWG